MPLCTHIPPYSHLSVLGARVVVKPTPPEKLSQSGLILLNNDKEPKYEGTVVVAGPGVRLENGQAMPMEIGIGMKVIYSRMAGVPIEDEITGEQLLVINERDVIAIIEEPQRWQHFKGGVYRFLMQVKEATSGAEDDDEVVIYQSEETGEMYARKAEEFYGKIIIDDLEVRRFMRIA